MSAFCSSLDGGELMIINRNDFQSKILVIEQLRKKFELYVNLKEDETKIRIEGIRTQLEKY